MENSKDFDALLEKYDYEFDEAIIAQEPATPRDSAKLLIHNRATDETTVATFADLAKYLPKNAVLVFNETKVIPARFLAFKETGGRVEFLFIKKYENGFIALAPKPVSDGSELFCGPYTLKVIGKREEGYFAIPSCPMDEFMLYLDGYGEMPLPPYIKHTKLTDDEQRDQYQTIFAREEGSVAAPTASLHFTDKLFRDLYAHGIESLFVTLHVGLGTFATLREDQVAKGALHEEEYSIDEETAEKLTQYKKEGRKIIAVGTTVIRTLESAAKNGGIVAGRGTTNIFIKEGYAFKFIDGIVTNFHVPKSSLLMLVAAFAGREKILSLYEFAKKQGFRFFSFGDGMLII